MRPVTRIVLVTLCATLTLALPKPSAAVTGDALSLEVLIDGRSLHEFHARDAIYVEAVRHAEYALRLTNRTGRRMAVALSVDGLNTIDAKSGSAAEASKWVLDPWQTVTIEGWQIGPDAARRFFFTSEDKSYGAWLGATANLGVIEAVAFRELVPPPPRRPLVGRRQRDTSVGMRSGESAAPQASGKAAPAPAEELTDDMAATGIGRKVDHRVTRVRMQLEPSPATHLRLRYEYREQLVRLGVLPTPEEERALARRERAHGFDDVDFAPDPWGGR